MLFRRCCRRYNTSVFLFLLAVSYLLMIFLSIRAYNNVNNITLKSSRLPRYSLPARRKVGVHDSTTTRRFPGMEAAYVKTIQLPWLIWNKFTNSKTGMLLTGPSAKKHALHDGMTYQKMTTKRKVILMWNDVNNPTILTLGNGPRLFQNCKVSNCELSKDFSMYQRSDALLFFTSHFKPVPRMPRPPGQRWVLFGWEAPKRFKIAEHREIDGLINWTMTYRQDSDILAAYGGATRRQFPKADHRDYAAIMTRKPRMAAWMVGNCRWFSKREVYVAQLIAHGIEIDIYGGCGNGTFVCPRSEEKKCMSMLNKTYKFYIAFENTLCKDYTTEKLYKVLPLDVIPIVRGGSDYSRMVPHKWYIDTNDFSSSKELAAYLKYLDRNPEEYRQYFRHRNEYILGAYDYNGLPAWCDLCAKLNDPTEPPKVKINYTQWWHFDAKCHPPLDLKLTSEQNWRHKYLT